MDSSSSEEEPVPSWSELPKELLSDIGKRLNTDRIHVLRLRSVCPSWRSSVPPFSASPIKLSLPIPPGGEYEDRIDQFIGQFSVIESTLYSLEPCPPTQEKQIIVIKVIEEENESISLRFVTPIIDHSSDQVTFPKEVNLLDYRVTEIHKTYEADNYVYKGEPFCYDVSPTIRKIDFLNSDPSLKGRYGGRIYPILVTLDGSDELGVMNSCFLKPGDDQEWTWLSYNGNRVYFYDFINYKGKFYCVTSYGGVFSVDSSGNLTEIMSPISEDRERQYYLVQSLGDIFLVKIDQCLPAEKLCQVLKLDEENHKWEETKNLDGRVFFVGEHGLSFSVLAHDFPICKGGCQDGGIHPQYTKSNEDQHAFARVYNLEDDSIQGELHVHLSVWLVIE